MNIVFMGIPAFASVALEKILKSELQSITSYYST